ncbi:MAG: THUMP domain-containing protein [Bacteroidota bacterium]|nr:THUMP domain-containing protein [Bacteroidota bacterium]
MKEEQKFKMFAKTFQGLEEVLKKELIQLGASKVCIGKRGVEFYGDKTLLYKANFHLRTALKILKPILEFKAQHEIELYDAVQSISWDTIFDVHQTFAVDSVVYSQHFSHSKYVALKVKDAIVDQFRKKYKKRPYVETESPDVQINIHISDNICTLSLDSSGESLHKRGYRIKATKAPLNEVLAAGMILLSGWDCKSNFIDPLCGSGTLLIEAAMIAYGIPPGIYRQKFGFESWKDFDGELLEEIYEKETETKIFRYKIIGSDISEIAIRIARENISNAALKRKIDLNITPIENYTPPENEKGTIVTNPPYGERLKRINIHDFYSTLGNLFKDKYQGYSIWLLSSNLNAIKYIGLKPSKKITLYNGPLECKFLEYDIYQGSKKRKFN